MQTGIHVQGGAITKKSVGAVAEAVDTIFASAHKNRMDQETVRTALMILSQVGTVQGATIANNSVMDRP